MDPVIHRAIIITAKDKQIKEITAQARWLGIEAIWQLTTTPFGFRSIMLCPESNVPETQEDHNERYALHNFMNWLIGHQYQHQAYWMEVEYGIDIISCPLANVVNASAYYEIDHPLQEDREAAISKLTYIEARALGIEALWNRYHPDKQTVED